MWRASALIIVLLVAPATARQPAAIRAEDLTLPPSHLPDGCELAPAPLTSGSSGRVWHGFWGWPPLPSNPWVGVDTAQAGKIRLRVEGAPRVVDAPVSKADLVRQELKLGEDVEEAYAAFYTTPDNALTSVFAVKLKASAGRIEGLARPRDPIRVGPYLVSHYGGGGECHDAVVKHLLSLRQ